MLTCGHMQSGWQVSRSTTPPKPGQEVANATTCKDQSANKRQALAPLGSPVYVLESKLQKQGINGKWKSWANIGIYLGQSPHHSRNVVLVLSWQTGLVSPQFHVQHDHCYHTVREERQKEPDLWMMKAGFVGSKEVAAAASRQAKQGASMPLRVDCGKRPDWTIGKRLFEQRERIAPRKLTQRELDQREQQLLRRKSFIRTQIVSRMQKVSTRIQNPRHPMARRVGYIGMGNALLGRIKGAAKAQLGVSSALRIVG
jgi:hypothetical protein